MLNNNVIDEFSTDAREPKGSSGIPILNELKRNELINTCIFVVRYFGGSKLGISGLIHAYGTSALDCIKNSQIQPWIKKDLFEVNSNYESFGMLEKIIFTFNGEIVEKDFQDKIKLRVKIKQELSIEFLSQFNELKFVKINRIIID